MHSQFSLFHSSAFLETLYLALIPIDYKTCNFGLDRSTMKGTLLEEHRTFSAASLLPFKGLS